METAIKASFVIFAIIMALASGHAIERPLKRNINGFVSDIVIFALLLIVVAVWWETPDLPATIGKTAITATLAVYGICDVVGSYRHRLDKVIETSTAGGLAQALTWIACATAAMILWP